jgi:hypothetical protein
VVICSFNSPFCLSRHWRHSLLPELTDVRHASPFLGFVFDVISHNESHPLHFCHHEIPSHSFQSEILLYTTISGLTLTSFLASLLGMTYVPCWGLLSVDATIYQFRLLVLQILWDQSKQILGCEHSRLYWQEDSNLYLDDKVGPRHVVDEKAKRHKSSGTKCKG